MNTNWMNLFLLPLCLILADCGGSSRPAQTPESESPTDPIAEDPSASSGGVKMNFAWPVDKKFKVSYEVIQEENGETMTSKMSTDVEIKKADNELHILFSNAAFSETPGGGRLPPNVADAMASLTPSYRVSDAGDFIGLIAAQEQYDAVMAKLDIPEGLKKMLFGPFAPEALSNTTKTDWEFLVSKWKGKEIFLGKTITEQIESELPNAPGQTISEELTYEVQKCPCDSDDSTNHCVQITGASSSEGEEFAKAFQAAIAKMTGISSVAKPVNAEMKSSFELILDPATLLPYKLVKTRTTNIEQVIMDETVSMNAVSKEIRTYQY